MGEALSDLEELVLRCRKAAAKGYIVEAVACYKAGAYRSAVLATWIAVVFDFVAKLRELEMTGDGRAKTVLESFEKARQSGDVKASLDFERQLVARARDEFELFSPIESKDFERLFEDRNRCAHPSMVSAEDPYEPSAELARMHIRNAVIHLLALPPVQGKAAIESVLRDVESEYFPKDTAKAVDFLKGGPFQRARDVLARNVTIALLKDLVQKGWSSDNRKRRFAALNAVLHLHQLSVETVFKDSLPNLLANVDDSHLYRICYLLASVPEARSFVGASAEIKIRQYIQDVSEEDLARTFPAAVLIPSFRPIVLSRLSDAGDDTLATIIKRDTSADYGAEALKRFSKSRSFDSATIRFEGLIRPLAEIITSEQELEILETYRTNNQVWPARAMASLLKDFLLARGPVAKSNKAAWRELYKFVESQSEWIPSSDDLLTSLREVFSFKKS